jgi:hypothetical protein
MVQSRDPSYSNSQIPPAERLATTEIPEGVISASLVVLTLVAVIIGGIVGMLLGTWFPSGSRLIAVPAGFIATVVASIARYKLVGLVARARAVEARIPMVLVVNAAIASVAGSLTAHDLMTFVGAETSPGLLGALAGLLSAVLTALLMIAYHANPNPPR